MELPRSPFMRQSRLQPLQPRTPAATGTGLRSDSAAAAQRPMHMQQPPHSPLHMPPSRVNSMDARTQWAPAPSFLRAPLHRPLPPPPPTSPQSGWQQQQQQQCDILWEEDWPAADPFAEPYPPFDAPAYGFPGGVEGAAQLQFAPPNARHFQPLAGAAAGMTAAQADQHVEWTHHAAAHSAFMPPLAASPRPPPPSPFLGTARRLPAQPAPLPAFRPRKPQDQPAKQVAPPAAPSARTGAAKKQPAATAATAARIHLKPLLTGSKTTAASKLEVKHEQAKEAEPPNPFTVPGGPLSLLPPSSLFQPWVECELLQPQSQPAGLDANPAVDAALRVWLSVRLHRGRDSVAYACDCGRMPANSTFSFRAARSHIRREHGQGRVKLTEEDMAPDEEEVEEKQGEERKLQLQAESKEPAAPAEASLAARPSVSSNQRALLSNKRISILPSQPRKLRRIQSA